MRIIGGSARGRRLQSPKSGVGKPAIRPTSDRVREAIFNIIGPETTGDCVLDLFAGTGALGLESLSRGARSAVFVDSSSAAVSIIKKNINLCGFADRSRVLKRDLGRGLSFLEDLKPANGFSIIFVDPPYGKAMGDMVLAEIDSRGFISAEGTVVFEESAGNEMPERVGDLVLYDQRRYGDTGVWFYRVSQS